MSASGSCDSAVDGLGGAEAGQDEVHVAVTSTIVQMSTQFMLQVVMGAEGTHVDCYEDSSRDAEDETCACACVRALAGGECQGWPWTARFSVL
jgi:hypothetical protein